MGYKRVCMVCSHHEQYSTLAQYRLIVWKLSNNLFFFFYLALDPSNTDHSDIYMSVVIYSIDLSVGGTSTLRPAEILLSWVQASLSEEGLEIQGRLVLNQTILLTPNGSTRYKDSQRNYLCLSQSGFNLGILIT
ncbi:hypothetical protein PoB_000108400 [Plakobranchus ocellatus]|uniref:Uncharacterized protein n=1 Tax=Plakobranchus ocellatus TaxID=259542 RepID=A0AAV3XUM2_9GAST|nr:hypothetical protein PoB_000108400 [Plakobranchus ocellatus]